MLSVLFDPFVTMLLVLPWERPKCNSSFRIGSSYTAERGLPACETIRKSAQRAAGAVAYYDFSCTQSAIVDRLSDSAILKKIERQPKGSAGFKQLVRELGLHGNARQELSERLQRLVSSGQLMQVDSDRYAIPKAAAGKNAVVGKLSMHRDGFGFVTPDPPLSTHA